MNKRGDFTGLLFLIAMIGAFAIFVVIIGYVVPPIYDGLIQRIGISEEINQSLVFAKTVSQTTVPVIWWILFAGMIFGLFITAYFVPSHPAFLPIFAILLIIAIIVSIAISNAYEELYTSGLLGNSPTYSSSIYFVISLLPFVSFIIGLIALILSYAKPGGYDAIPV